MAETKTVGYYYIQRVDGWCESIVFLFNDLSLLSWRSQSDSIMSRYLPYMQRKCIGLDRVCEVALFSAI